MFAKSIIDSDSFLEMSISARLLYYDLGMRADDDGFVDSPKKIFRMIGATEDDLRLLITRGFIIPFHSGIVVITHWKTNNYIRSDRYHETRCKAEKDLLSTNLNGDYILLEPNGIPSGNHTVDKRYTEVRLGKDSNIYTSPKGSCKHTDYQSIVDNFNLICSSLPKVRRITDARKRAIKKATDALEGLSSFEEVFQKVEASDFLTGRNGSFRVCGFDWIMEPANLTKIIEGNYDNQDSPGKLQGKILEGGGVQL